MGSMSQVWTQVVAVETMLVITMREATQIKIFWAAMKLLAPMKADAAVMKMVLRVAALGKGLLHLQALLHLQVLIRAFRGARELCVPLCRNRFSYVRSSIVVPHFSSQRGDDPPPGWNAEVEVGTPMYVAVVDFILPEGSADG
jgi:hypothetical protein